MKTIFDWEELKRRRSEILETGFFYGVSGSIGCNTHIFVVAVDTDEAGQCVKLTQLQEPLPLFKW